MQLVPEKLEHLKPERKEALLRRSLEDVSQIYEHIRGILEEVRLTGDEANLKQHRELRPGLKADDFRVTRDEIQSAYAQVEPKVVEHLRKAAANIRAFHEAQVGESSWQMEVAPGVVAGRKHTPLDAVGCYVPGGRASYPSTALMTLLPAKAAGVPRIVVCTPPGEGMSANAPTLVACDICGVDQVYKLGGPWAIGSLAYGTATVPRVHKIVGPGNKYVMAAKLQVFGSVDIDSPAGPSEALLLADATANPQWLALDLLSQMEHDPDAGAVLVTTEETLAEAVCAEIVALGPTLPRREILDQAARYCAVLVAKSLDSALEFVNDYAPEHLQIVTREPFAVLRRVRNAGSVFLGPYAPVPVGDYASGTNHVLPTGQAAKAFSGLSVDDFIKKPTFQHLTRDGLAGLQDTVTTLALAEGLPIHAMTVKARFQD